ncbi:ATP-binding protein [Embleya scabrispora]|uniref:ATP-binding protein n=1 Tax=Embleya scabrispora TaxID=159449 RepID=UPI0003A085C7|nr:AAA family ATPase [Embleya scabrispora]MYS84971.1 AAA family ATPase [Streptomyces sp. SID5474]
MPSALIGRDHCLGVLRSRVERARAGHGGLVLVGGEAGIGKTALVRQMAHEALGLDMCVLRGTCWDSGATPDYWPWTQALRNLRRETTDAEWALITAAAGTTLPVLLGEHATPPGERVAGPDGFAIGDAVTTMLGTASRNRPVLLVLEDLHWADAASLGLLEFVARHTWFERLLVVGTCREFEARQAGRRLPAAGAETAILRPTGLNRVGVAELMTRTAGARPEEAVVDEVHRRTAGNPFFVEETARLWAAGGPVGAVSPGVRAAVHRRLALLDEAVVELLRVASVLGPSFDIGPLARAAGVGEIAARRLLAQAVDAHVLEPVENGGVAFRHDLVREALYTSLADDRRCRLHAAVVRALPATGSVAHPMRPNEAAHHAYLAGTELAPDAVVDLLVAAARHAAGRLANEEAVRHYLHALERLGTRAPHRRVKLILDLALARQLTGAHQRSWLAFEEAAALARRHDPVLLGLVALTMLGVDARGDTSGLKSRLPHEAHAALTGYSPGAQPTPPDRAAPVDSPSPYGDPCVPAAVVARHVTAAARRSGDDEALQTGLWAAVQASWGPDTLRERALLTTELSEVSRRRGDRWMEHIAISLRWVALLELADPRFLDQLQALVAVARASGSPRMTLTSLIDRSVVCACQGRFEEAAALLGEVVALDGPQPNYRHFGCQHAWSMALLRGDAAELDRAHRALREHDHPFADLLEGIGALEFGDRPRYPCAVPVGDGDGTVAHRSIIPLWLRHQAQAAAVERDPARCEQARAALAPYRGRWLVSLYGWDIGGPASLWTGIVDAAREHWDDAVREFADARRSADRLHARPWSVRAGIELAGALLARDADGDRARAGALLIDAGAEADRLGMIHLVDRVRRLSTPSTGRASSTEPTTPPGSTGAAVAQPLENCCEFRRDGSVWRLSFAGRVVHMPDAKGLRDVHRLLGQPGTAVPATRLLAPEGGAVVSATAAMGGDALLDEEARTRYRRRLDRLDEEIEQAVDRGDDRQAAEYDRERVALLAELRRAAGLGGRVRRLGNHNERARKTVTARIRDALRRLDERHPELAAHLRAGISTGSTCCYTPDPRFRWRL